MVYLCIGLGYCMVISCEWTRGPMFDSWLVKSRFSKRVVMDFDDFGEGTPCDLTHLMIFNRSKPNYKWNLWVRISIT